VRLMNDSRMAHAALMTRNRLNIPLCPYWNHRGVLFIGVLSNAPPSAIGNSLVAQEFTWRHVMHVMTCRVKKSRAGCGAEMKHHSEPHTNFVRIRTQAPFVFSEVLTYTPFVCHMILSPFRTQTRISLFRSGEQVEPNAMGGQARVAVNMNDQDSVKGMWSGEKHDGAASAHIVLVCVFL